MSFGWSLGDVVAGIKILWAVYDSVSDGPLNASLQCEQFFEEFSLVTQCLEDWQRKAQAVQDDSLGKLHLQLQEQCKVFIQRHFHLIQEINPESRVTREQRQTWLRNAPFLREQVLKLYQQMRWPFEKKEVARLRKKLMLFLALATYHVSSSTHNVTVENRDILLDIRTSHLEVVNKNLDLVSLIIDNLRRLANPLDRQHQSNQIDYSSLRQFENALLPPQPIRAAIEASPARSALAFGHDRQHEIQDRMQYIAAPSIASSQDSTTIEVDNRVILSERLQNFRQRSVRTHDPTINAGSGDGTSIQHLLERLRDTRNQIGDVVGFPTGNSSDEHLSLAVSNPRGALLEELGVWDAFGERVQYELQRRENLVVQAATNASPVITRTVPKPVFSSGSPTCLSPMSSPLGTSASEDWFGNGSPESSRGSFLHTRSPSNASSSPATAFRLPRFLPVILQYHDQAIQGSVQQYSRSDDGEVSSVMTISQDGRTEIRHLVDRTVAGNVESSMKPYLDNSHVDKVHKYRVQFLGSHIVKVTKLENSVQPKIQIRTQPKYKFGNKSDYYEFQQLLLGKDVLLITDVEVIKSKEKDPQCRLGTIRMLVEPNYKARSILYFRGTTSKEHKTAAFMEWPTSIFKDPKEPSPKCKSLTLESANGKSLSVSKGTLSRRSTQGSVTTIASFESANAAHSRLQERSSGKGIKGLIIDFYDAKDCHEFWKEFVTKEIQFSLPDPALT